MFEWLSIPTDMNYGGCKYCMSDFKLKQAKALEKDANRGLACFSRIQHIRTEDLLIFALGRNWQMIVPAPESRTKIDLSNE